MADAFEWYARFPLPGYGSLTASALVRRGRGDEVIDYIDAVDAGVNA